jgi:hypothetical protein
MSNPPPRSLSTAIVNAASQGAAGALIGAMIASYTEPLVNRLLVKRMLLSEAISDIPLEQVIQYFKTTLPTNFIKFPIFEVLQELVKSFPESTRGILSGFIFTTVTLPITNYRFMKSLNVPTKDIKIEDLFKAYVPTVLRDIVYANSRIYSQGVVQNLIGDKIENKTIKTAILMAANVFIACIISSPGNEIRGFLLQPADKRKSFSEFFQLEKYLRSTLIGASVMSLSLGLATVITPHMQNAISQLKERKGLLIGLLFGFVALRKLKELENKKPDGPAESKKQQQ